MKLSSAGSSPASGSPRGTPFRRLYELLYFHILPHTRPDDLCVLGFSLLVVSLFFTLDQPFHWNTFWIFIKDPLIWFTALFAPLILILLVQDRYDVRRVGSRFVHGFAQFLRDFIPYLICVVIYLNLSDVVYLVSPVNRDPWLIAADQALFGVQLSQWMEQFSNVLLDEWMYFTYTIFGWYPITLGMFFLARGQRRPFRDLLLAYILACLIGYLGYVAVPAIGPRYYLEYTVDLRGRFFAAVELAMKNTLYIPRDCFPSLHTANTLVVLGMAYKYRRGLFWWYLPFGASTIVATVYLRYHYVVDLIAGTALAAFVVVIAPRWNDRWDAWTARIRARAAERTGQGKEAP